MKVKHILLLVALLVKIHGLYGQNFTISFSPSSPNPNDFTFVTPSTAGLPLSPYTNSSLVMNYKGSNTTFSKITVEKTVSSVYPGIEMWVRAGLVLDDPNNISFGIATDAVLVSNTAQTIIQHIKTPSNGQVKARNVYIEIRAVDYSLLTADRFGVTLIFTHLAE